MKRIITQLALLYSFSLTAQITVDSTDFGWVGDVVTYVADTNITGLTVLAPTGSAQTFDYSSVGVTDISQIQFLDPATTPSAGSFPNSNLVLVQTGGDLVYMIKSDTAVIIDGIYGDILNQGQASAVDFNPNIIANRFPMNYQDTYTSVATLDTIVEDTFTGFFDSLRVIRHLTQVHNVDAYGTLQLPGYNEQVLRSYDKETTVDSIFGQVLGTWQPVLQTVEVKHFYRFTGKSKDYFLLEVEADSLGNVLNVKYQTNGLLTAGIINYSNISCNGQTDGIAKVTVVGGLSPYTYIWDDPNSSTTQQISGLAAGNYHVTVTDAANSTNIASVVIIEPDTIGILATQIGADYGNDEGFINISVSGGTPEYTYAWSNGSATKNLTALNHGNYTVTITDSRGCTNSKTFIVENLTSVFDIFRAEEVSIYPNPTNGIIQIKTTYNWNMSIYSLSGVLLLTKQGIGNNTLDLNNQPTGIYIIIISVNNRIYSGKIQIME